MALCISVSRVRKDTSSIMADVHQTAHKATTNMYYQAPADNALHPAKPAHPSHPALPASHLTHTTPSQNLAKPSPTAPQHCHTANLAL